VKVQILLSKPTPNPAKCRVFAFQGKTSMADSVRKESSAVSAMSQHWPIITDLLGGTPAMRKAGTRHLPQWPNEDNESYAARLKVATLFPAFKRTIEVLAGKPFSKPLTYGDDVPAKIKKWCEDIDLQGRNLHSFAASLCEQALAYGLSGILVDYPKAEGIRTAADEQKAGVRPYFVQIHPQNILGWKSMRINGLETLTLLRLRECVIEDDGEFGEKEVEQVRVLYPGKWEVYRKKEGASANADEWVLHDEGVTTLKKIPFVPVYGNRTGYMTAMPPLLEMAHMNVKHFQSQSDQDTIMHVARVPILAVIGVDDDKWNLTVGASSAVKLPIQGDMKFVEHSGAAIEAGRKHLLDLEDQMRQAGAELLVIKPANITEAQTLSDNEQGRCTLQRITADEKDAINQGLQLMAEWVGEKTGGNINIYDDFGFEQLAAASADLLQKIGTSRGLSKQTVFEELQRRGIIRPELKWTEEEARLKAEEPDFGMMTGDQGFGNPKTGNAAA
jgi:hypothetical protein